MQLDYIPYRSSQDLDTALEAKDLWLFVAGDPKAKSWLGERCHILSSLSPSRNNQEHGFLAELIVNSGRHTNLEARQGNLGVFSLL